MFRQVSDFMANSTVAWASAGAIQTMTLDDDSI
jgi:hypothetical protein